MAVSYQNSRTTGGSAETLSDAFDVGSGSDRAIVVFCIGDDTVNNFSATYNGVSLTNQGGVRLGSPANNYYRCLTLLNPASGSNTLAVTNTGGTVFEFTAAAYNGVSSFGSGFGTGSNTATSITRNTTIASDGTWVVSSASGRLGPKDLTPGTGVTNTRVTSGSYVPLGDSGPHNVSASPIAHTWDNTGSLENIIMAITVLPVATSTPTKLKTRDTVTKAKIKTLDTSTAAKLKTLDTIT